MGDQQQIAVIALCNIKDKIRGVLCIVSGKMNIVHKIFPFLSVAASLKTALRNLIL